LLITVGAAYVKTKEAPVKLILKDLLDMVKGVQQPTRGLFLRFYLMKMMKDILPDKDTPYEGEGGDVNDAIDFIL
jgi:vacuolar protein sorting-associated protein 35